MALRNIGEILQLKSNEQFTEWGKTKIKTNFLLFSDVGRITVILSCLNKKKGFVRFLNSDQFDKQINISVPVSLYWCVMLEPVFQNK